MLFLAEREKLFHFSYLGLIFGCGALARRMMISKELFLYLINLFLVSFNFAYEMHAVTAGDELVPSIYWIKIVAGI